MAKLEGVAVRDFKFIVLRNIKVMVATHEHEISIWNLRNMSVIARKTIFPVCSYAENSLVYLPQKEKLLVLDSAKKRVLTVPLGSFKNSRYRVTSAITQFSKHHQKHSFEMLKEDLVFFKVSGLPLTLLTMLHKVNSEYELMNMEAHLQALSNFFVLNSKYPLMHIAAAAPFENVVKIMLAKDFFYSFTED